MTGTTRKDRVWMHQELDYQFELVRKTMIIPLLGVNSDTFYADDIPNLTYRRTFTRNYAGALVESSPIPQLTLNLLATYGGNPNYTPAVLPRLFDENWVQATVTVKPTRALTIANSYLLDRNFVRPTGEFGYDSQILRTNSNN